jgi:hypothetical protein
VNTYKAEPLPVARGARIRVVPHEEPKDKSGTVSVTLRFAVDNELVKVDLDNVRYDDAIKSYLIGPDLLFVFARDFIKKLDAYGKLDPPKGLTELTSKSIEVTVQPTGANASPKTTTNQLRVDIEMYLPDREKPLPQAKDAKAGDQKTTPQPENPPAAAEKPEAKPESQKPNDRSSGEQNPPTPAGETAKPSAESPQSKDQHPKAPEPRRPEQGGAAPDNKKTSHSQTKGTAKRDQDTLRGRPPALLRPAVSVDPMTTRAEAALPPLPPGFSLATPSRAANPGHGAPTARVEATPPTRFMGKTSGESLLQRILGRD